MTSNKRDPVLVVRGVVWVLVLVFVVTVIGMCTGEQPLRT